MEFINAELKIFMEYDRILEEALEETDDEE